MDVTTFRRLFTSSKPIIGVIHLPALPGYPDSPGIDAVLDKAVSDLSALERGGVDGVLVENFADRPFRLKARPETVAAMTRVVRELVLTAKTAVIGVEVLLNDPAASLAVAKMAGAGFMRTDFFVDPMERPEFEGQMDIDPEGLMSYRQSIGADDVLVLADIQVKFAAMLVDRSLAESARLAAHHGADAIGVTGNETGNPPSASAVEQAKSGAGACPVLVGSGLDVANASMLMAAADGAIVGTSVKTGDHIDAAKVGELVDTVRALNNGVVSRNGS
ncbi:MAG: BtpA/SgcQ family protein [Acidimicrobiia bacterium]